VEGTVIGTLRLNRERPGLFFEVAYPPALTRGRTSVVVRLQARPGAIGGGLFGARTLRTYD